MTLLHQNLTLDQNIKAGNVTFKSVGYQFEEILPPLHYKAIDFKEELNDLLIIIIERPEQNSGR